VFDHKNITSNYDINLKLKSRVSDSRYIYKYVIFTVRGYEEFRTESPRVVGASLCSSSRAGGAIDSSTDKRGNRLCSNASRKKPCNGDSFVARCRSRAGGGHRVFRSRVGQLRNLLFREVAHDLSGHDRPDNGVWTYSSTVLTDERVRVRSRRRCYQYRRVNILVPLLR